jgi:hypothetical protein
MFASSVGFIGAFHLISTTVERLGKGKNSSEKRQVTRDDWYCFFKPSDLLGTDATGSTDTMQPTISDDQNLEQRRRQQASRPRLRA